MRELEEVKEQTIIDKFYHIPGPQNIADMATRTGVMLHELAEGSLWQLGPKFLRMPRELWPISREFRNLLPKEEKRTKFYTMFNALKIGDISKTEEIKHSSNTLDKVRKTLAIYLKVEMMTNEKGWKKPLSTQQKEERSEWVKEMPVEDLAKADHAMTTGNSAQYSRTE